VIVIIEDRGYFIGDQQYLHWLLGQRIPHRFSLSFRGRLRRNFGLSNMFSVLPSLTRRILLALLISWRHHSFSHIALLCFFSHASQVTKISAHYFDS
jgi:hypothetical protein